MALCVLQGNFHIRRLTFLHATLKYQHSYNLSSIVRSHTYVYSKSYVNYQGLCCHIL